MRPIVTDGVAWSVGLSLCLSVGLSDTIVSPAKSAEPIEVPFGILNRMHGPMEPSIKRGAHWRHLAITTEQSGLFSQIA